MCTAFHCNSCSTAVFCYSDNPVDLFDIFTMATCKERSNFRALGVFLPSGKYS